MTLEAITPLVVVSVHNTTNTRRRRRKIRKTLERNGSDCSKMENHIRVVSNLRMAREKCLRESAVAAVMTLCRAESAGAAARKRGDGVHLLS